MYSYEYIYYIQYFHMDSSTIVAYCITAVVENGPRLHGIKTESDHEITNMKNTVAAREKCQDE